jgi:hypothetical protein
MLRANHVKVLATGPVFRTGNDSTVRRILLIKGRMENSAAAEYFLGIETLHEGNASGRMTTRRLKTQHFTLAVRHFCDYLLDQALREDTAIEAEAGDPNTAVRRLLSRAELVSRFQRWNGGPHNRPSRN